MRSIVCRIQSDFHCATAARLVAARGESGVTDYVRAIEIAMRTRTKRPYEVSEIDETCAITVMEQPADTQPFVSHMGRIGTVSCRVGHKGYCLTAQAKPTNADLYAADLMIESPSCPVRRFRALDYFYDAAQAVRYAVSWGRIWVDHQSGQDTRVSATANGGADRGHAIKRGVSPC